MMTSTGFQMAVAMTMDRMTESERQAVREAIRGGSRPTELCRYREGGPLVLRCEVPETWRHLEVFQVARDLNCTIPADKEAATIAWFKARSVEPVPSL